VALQTGRHRDYFLSVTPEEAPPGTAQHAASPSSRAALVSLMLLLVALVAVVGDAKLVSPTVERAVSAAGLPVSVVGVIIAMMILLPETLAAMRAAQRDRMQISLNLAFGSAIASIGLTIPTIAVASIWLPVPLHLGLDAIHIVPLALTCVVTVLTVVPDARRCCRPACT
jgi:Ca2+:H+ antiporter